MLANHEAEIDTAPMRCAVGRLTKSRAASKRWSRESASYSTRPRAIGAAIEYADIAILFQSMAQVTIYEEAFKAQQLPFLTIAGRGYYDRQEVWDMLELLRCLHNPADELALATVLRSPMFAFSDDLLLAYAFAARKA